MKLTRPHSFVSLQLRLSLVQNCSTVVYRVSSQASGLQPVATNTTMIRSLYFGVTRYDRMLKHLAFQDCGDLSPNTRVSNVPSSTFENPSAIFSIPILRHIPDWSPRMPRSPAVHCSVLTEWTALLYPLRPCHPAIRPQPWATTPILTSPIRRQMLT